eukprot:CAMPEP_0197007352 /NCGR_PEP_ID=MMETSP1380-20130617/40187_1 /TAXON_ID=5936 /ORGANISM="Euplotes crassus, Strain CT5" /LENGTH=43 /DNA_ID= /DNA_START= /DNA_END= /DNA_ORIENTATION=
MYIIYGEALAAPSYAPKLMIRTGDMKNNDWLLMYLHNAVVGKS